MGLKLPCLAAAARPRVYEAGTGPLLRGAAGVPVRPQHLLLPAGADQPHRGRQAPPTGAARSRHAGTYQDSFP